MQEDVVESNRQGGMEGCSVLKDVYKKRVMKSVLKAVISNESRRKHSAWQIEISRPSSTSFMECTDGWWDHVVKVSEFLGITKRGSW